MKIDNEFEVVISGIGGKFAKANNLEEFKDYLLKNESLLGTRWDEGELGVSNVIGVNQDIEHFDTSYFGIHREQCNYMDPMQRMVLERTFEALIDAGVSPAEIRGKKVAVYSGSSVGENDNIFYESIVSGFGVTGHSRSMMSNRVSYWLNLKGPSCAYDNNWLNGIEVLHAAYDSIRQGHCEAAIVATSNLNLHPEISWLYTDMGLISPDGVTRSFDADANGYARADGTVVLFVQRACDAKRSYATILGISAQYNGNQNGSYRTIDSNSMQEFMNEFYSNIKVNPKDVEFVECYGSANKEIDTAELNAIDKVYCKDRYDPLLIGSVKPNTGHAEASSIFLSLAKVLIAMESGIIPANLNYSKPNPNVPGLVEGRLEVVTKNKEWGSGLAAVNGVGLSSSYGHILLKGNPKVKKGKVDELPRLIPVSTRTEEGIQAILNLLKTQTDVDPEYAALIQDTFKKGISGHLYRGYAVLDGSEDVKIESEFFPGNKRPIWFVYSGMGSQWCKMASDLMSLPIFAESIQRSHKILEPKGVDLLRIVSEDDDKMFDNILHSFVGIAAMQIALTDVLKALEIVPDGIIGHSVGELGCAYADGCLTAEQMILSAYSRGKASLEATLVKGMMAAVGMGYQQIKDQCPPTIEVACHNGPDSSTISGPTKDMEAFVEELKGKNVFARLVNVADIAYHSKYIKPAAPLLLQYLKEVIPDPLPRSSKWISTSIPEENWGSDLAKTSSAEYHTNNLLNQVLFEEGSKHIPKEAILIEIAPHGLLQAILKRSIKGNCTNIPLTLKSNKSGLNFLLSALGKLYLAGVDLNLPAIYSKVEYPISRGTKSLTPLIHWEHGEKWRCGLEDKKNFISSTRTVNISLKKEEFRGLIGHQIKNGAIIPVSVYLQIVYDLFITLKGNSSISVVFENLEFKKVLYAPKHGNIQLFIMIQRGSGYFEISLKDELIVNGTIRVPETEKLFASVGEIDVPENAVQLSGSDVYSEFNHRGHKYGVGYKYIKNLSLTEEGSVSTTQWNNNWSNFLEALFQQCLFHKGERYQNSLKVISVQKIAFSPEELPKEPEDVKVSYDYSTQIITTTGMQIFKVVTKPLVFDHQFTALNSLELIPLSNRTYKNIENAIAVSLQIVLDDYNILTDSTMIVEIESKNASLKPNLQNVLNKYSNLHANVSTVDNASLILVPQTESLFVLLNDTINENCIKLITSTHAFLFVQTDAKLLSYPELTQVVEFTINGVSYSLVRKSFLLDPVLIHIKGDTLTGKDVSREGLPWVNALKSSINSQSEKKIFIVTSITPTEGITNFIKEVQSFANTDNLRFVFNYDKKNFEFNPSQNLCKRIIKNDLKLTVIKNDSLHSIVSLSMDLVDDLVLAYQAESNIVNNTQIEYVGLNLYDETINFKKTVKPQLGNVDYSGTTEGGQKVMGLARLDEANCKLVPDPILTWSFPNRWTLEDAATVPNAHAIAYYTLFVLGKLKPSENVLIHGAASALGIAAISVAASIGCTIYATVSSNTQKAYLTKLYRFLGDRNVYSCRDSSFEPRLMMTSGGVGAHVILNCVSGNLLNATLRCVAEFGRILQIGKLDLEENHEIGMSIFLRNVGFIGVTPEYIFDAPVDVKQKIHDYVEQGIEDIIVRPLTRIPGDVDDINANLKTLQSENHIGKIILKLSDSLSFRKLNINSGTQYICNPKYSYLIYGGASESWTDVVEWLIFRGARTVVVSSECKSQQAHINRRLKLLQNYFNANIVFSSIKAQTRDSAADLIAEVHELGQIGAIFVLPSKNTLLKNSEIKAVQYLDLALRNKAPKALLVNFLSNAAGICQQRIDSDFLTNHVQWPESLDFSLVVHSLDGILRYKAGNVFIDNIQSKDNIQETTQSLYKKLTYLLPRSIDTIRDDVVIASLKPDFIQLPTLCPRVVRDLPPLFVIPGLFGRNAVKDLASQLLHPVYCANYPTSSISFSKLASELVEKIKEIYPSGPYNIVGISYGGPLAIEVVKLLEKNKEVRTQLFLIDGAPDTIQGVIKNLGEGKNSEIGFLCRILSLTNPHIVKELTNLTDWNSRVQCILKHHDCSPDDKDFLSENLTTFKNYLDSILTIQPPAELVLAPITLLRPTGASKDDVCGLHKYFKDNIDIFLINGNHSSILKEKDLANAINNKVIC